MVRSIDWSPTATDLDWIEATGRPAVAGARRDRRRGRAEGIPIVDRDSGRMLAVLAANRRRIVEIGTAIGYSTLWMALARPADGTIVTIDPDTRPDRPRTAYWWRRAGLAGRADHRRQRAGARGVRGRDRRARRSVRHGLHRRAQGRVLGYLDALIEDRRLAPGALLVADNVLWSGRTSGRPTVAARRSQHGTLREFCARVSADPAFEPAILPIGDGLLVACTLRP